MNLFLSDHLELFLMPKVPSMSSEKLVALLEKDNTEC